jgi:DNA replication licensing factor MCM7
MYNKHENDINRRDFELDKAKLTEFVTTYTDKSLRAEDNIHGKKKYMIELQKIANQTLKVLEIHIEDLDHHFSNDSFFLELLKSNTKRYVNLFYEVVDKVMPRRTARNLEEELEPIEEVIQNQRMANLQANNGNSSERQVTVDQIPPELLRK